MHNCTGGKLTRGYTVALSLKLLCKDEELSNKQMTDAYVLGWCVELVSLVNFIESFSFYFLVIGDCFSDSNGNIPDL